MYTKEIHKGNEDPELYDSSGVEHINGMDDG